MIKRTIEGKINKIITSYNKMVFLSGPRQVGKTTLAKQYLEKFPQGEYFNWDIITHQKKLVKDRYFFEKADKNIDKPFLVIFDELHKYIRWKSYLKGVYDNFSRDYKFLVTGSGRLDLYKKGGDSLLGRYFGLVLFPLSLGELTGSYISFKDFKSGLTKIPSANSEKSDAYSQLFHFSGFPEPFKRSEKDFYSMWYQERKKLLVKQDIRDASNIRNISLLELLSHLVPEKVGSLLSINSIREEVGVAFETARDWIALLNHFYYMFQIRPYIGSIKRSLRKETKAYLYDWVEVPEEPERFENLVALHLYKAVTTWKNTGEGDIDLFYIRDKEKREVDFVVVEKNKPLCLIECKYSDKEISPHLQYFMEKLNTPMAIQLVHKTGISRKVKAAKGNIVIISADRWLTLLP